MSKFIKKLQQISENAVTQMGFRASSASPVQRMLIIASITQIKAKAAIQPAGFEVNAMLIQGQNLKGEIKNIKQIANQSAGIPLGIWFESMAEVDARELREAGVDFLVFTVSQAPAALLQEDIGKVVKIDLNYDDRLINTIEQLAIDAVLIDFTENKGAMNILQIMNCQRIAGLISKPLLIATQQELARDEVKSLWEAGVNGFIIEAREEDRQGLDNLCRVIKDLPPIARKTKGRRVSLPNSGQIAVPDTDDDV